MRLSRAGLDLIKSHEGFRSFAYDDLAPNRPARPPINGTLTIGYGETQGVRIGDTITEEAASDQLMRRLRRDFEPAVQRLVTVPLTQYQYDALVSFVYNVGEGNLQRSTLLRRLNDGRYDDVPAQLMRWTKSKGRELRGLVRRRRDEAELWRGLREPAAVEVETPPVPQPADEPSDGTPPLASRTNWSVVGQFISTLVAATADNPIVQGMAVAAVIGLGGYIVYSRIRKSREDGV